MNIGTSSLFSQLLDSTQGHRLLIAQGHRLHPNGDFTMKGNRGDIASLPGSQTRGCIVFKGVSVEAWGFQPSAEALLRT